MPLTDRLRARHHGLWQAVVAHPFGALGVSKEAYASAAAPPTTGAFCDFLICDGHEGRFESACRGESWPDE